MYLIELAYVIVIIGMLSPLVAIWKKYQQRMAEIKAQMETSLALDFSGDRVRLHEEVAAFQETTPCFDMSFDGAPTRLEDHMDAPLTAAARASVLFLYAAAEEAPMQTVGMGQGR